MRSMQISSKKMPTRVRFCTILPTRSASEVRECS
ncbi:hypothetical protein Ahy_A08g040583 isoform E [Arachis hypogaea]|uniref:Uncharacterized protein n=1 Tax=Arachis hypogaea TaxID=3818 RepID=A0A445BZQ2_ARAHY|nr:hypothetical protein Ahy_A08g040583 isoform E [Arachis hypogaea]